MVSRDISIRSYLIKNFALYILIPFAVLGFIQMLIIFMDTYTDAINDSRKSIIKTGESFSQFVENSENALYYVSYNSDIHNLIKMDTDNYYFSSLIKARNVLIDSFINRGNYYSNAVIYDNDGKILSALSWFNDKINLADYEWKSELDATFDPIWISAYIDENDYSSGNEHIVTLAKKIWVYDSEPLGILAINIREKKMYDLLKNSLLPSHSTFLIQDRYNVITSHSDKNQIGSLSNIKTPDAQYDSYLAVVNGKAVLVSYYRESITGWQLIQILNLTTIFSDNFLYLFSSIIIFIALLAIFILISVRISRTISKPIYTLGTRMELVEKGIFEYENVKKPNIVEIDKLITRFSIMTKRLNNLIEEGYKSQLKEQALEAAVNKAELIMLQQQVNPHFLYNTLDSINWVASFGDTKEVSKMIAALSNFFRFNISRDENFVTIDFEVENVLNYIYLQQIRFGPSLLSEISVEPEIRNCLTMKLLLQPIVENAIQHGIKANFGVGKILIRIYKEQNSICFSIADNGVGMEQDIIDNIMSPEYHGESIGLRNTIQRLSLFFGEKSTFKIESKIGEGTIVTITIPILCQ